jgi:hypothetical protein
VFSYLESDVSCYEAHSGVNNEQRASVKLEVWKDRQDIERTRNERNAFGN